MYVNALSITPNQLENGLNEERDLGKFTSSARYIAVTFQGWK